MQTIQQILQDGEKQIVDRILGRDVTRAELSKAFDKVQPAGNWKGRIDATVEIGSDLERAMIERAVVFFTGSVPTFEPVRAARKISGTDGGSMLYRVRAAGYYATIGA